MALGMKQWMGLMVAGCALVAFWLLPPASFATPYAQPVGPTIERAITLHVEVTSTRLALQKLQWSDSLSALALATAKNGVAVGGAASLISGRRLAAVRALVEAEVARLAQRRPDAVVGVFVQPVEYAAGGAGGDIRVPSWAWDELYIGARAGRPFCLRVVAAATSEDPLLGHFARRRGVDGRTYSDVLGGCRFVAEHGMPGAEILSWLKNGGLRYARYSGVPSAREVERNRIRYRTLAFGLRKQDMADPIADDACRAGIAGTCLHAFLDPVSAALPVKRSRRGLSLPSATVIPMSGTPPLGPPSGYMLADLERKYGPRRFQRFWQSDAGVPAAFQAAFDEPLDQWLTSWIAFHENSTAAGPGLAAADALGALLVLGLCAVFGSIWARRRQVS